MDQFRIIYSAGKRFVRLDLLNTAASLAFYALFSLIPILLIVLFIAQGVYAASTISDFLIQQISRLFGGSVAEEISGAIQSMALTQRSGGYTVLSVVLLIWSASSVFSTLVGAFNSIFELPPVTGALSVVKQYFKTRFLSLILIILVAGLLIFSFFANLYLHALDSLFIERVTGLTIHSFNLLNYGVYFVLLTLCYLLVYWLCVDAKLHFRDLLAASVLTSAMLLGGKGLMAIYIGTNETITLFSSAGTVIVILMWIYFNSTIALFGCAYLKELNSSHEKRFSKS